MAQDDYLNNLLSSPLTGIIAGLLQAGGPSRMPTSFGQALGQGLQGGQAFQSAGIQNAMQQLQLQQAKQGQDYFNQFLGNQGSQPAQDSTPPQTPAQTDAPTTISAKPSLPTVQDPTQDPQYQQLMQQAMVAAHFKMDPQPMIDKANARLDYLKNQQTTLTPEQAKLIPGGILPGQTAQISPYSGKLSITGDSAIKDVTDYDPVTLQPIHHYKNMLTGKDVFPEDKGPVPIIPGQPLPGPYEGLAQQVANYDVKPPTAGSGRGAAYASTILTRAHEINPDFKAQNFDVSLKASKDFSTGKQGQGVKSFNVALKHLDTLSGLADAMQNGNVPLLNKLSNTWKTQTGAAAPTSFNAAKQIVGDEIVKAIVGSGGGVADRETAAATINAASSPAQLKQVIETYKQLMVGQLEGLKQQYQTTTFRNDFDKFLSPEALKVMQNTPVGQSAGKTLTYDPSTGTFK